MREKCGETLSLLRPVVYIGSLSLFLILLFYLSVSVWRAVRRRQCPRVLHNGAKTTCEQSVVAAKCAKPSIKLQIKATVRACATSSLEICLCIYVDVEMWGILRRSELRLLDTSLKKYVYFLFFFAVIQKNTN